jgi:hypothetical protein
MTEVMTEVTTVTMTEITTEIMTASTRKIAKMMSKTFGCAVSLVRPYYRIYRTMANAAH